MFKRYPPNEIRAYLELLDQKLSEPARLIIIGGFAVALRGAPQRVTSDIDLFNDPGPAFWKVVKANPSAIPISKVGISSQPYNFEDRFERVGDEAFKWL